MNRKKLCAIIIAFVAYCILLVIISANYKNKDKMLEEENTIEKAKQTDTSRTEEISKETGQTDSNVIFQSNDETIIDLLSSNAYAIANIDGKTDADTPWKSNIELLGTEYPEQGLFMMPGTVITYSVQVPAEAKLNMKAKMYNSIAKANISDGATIVVEIIQDGRSLITYNPIIVSGDGKEKSCILDLTEWKDRTIQLRIRCYDGGNDDAIGDWVVIKLLQLTIN